MTVTFSNRASRQLERALEYIRGESPAGADAVSARVTKAIDVLEDQPRAGRMTTTPRIRRYSLAPYPYVIFYRLVGDDVIVVRFSHAARRGV